MKSKLIKMAAEARKSSHSPYSNFPVGAAILCENGDIYTGTNVENACYPCGFCAEQVAYCKAVSSRAAGSSINVIACALVAQPRGTSAFITPCGKCLQVMSEFGRDTMVICATAKSLEGTEHPTIAGTFSLSTLMPHSFSSDDVL